MKRDTYALKQRRLKVTGRMIFTSTGYCLRHILEFLLSLAPEVSDQPLGGEGVLRRHPPAHHRVQESLSLACVESQHLSMKITVYDGGSQMKLALSRQGKTARMCLFIIISLEVL